MAQEHGDHGQEHHEEHEGHGGGHDHHEHHSAMIADFKRRFFVSVILTVPILLLTPNDPGVPRS